MLLARALAMLVLLCDAVDALAAPHAASAPRVALRRASSARLAATEAAPSPEQLLELQRVRARLIGELDQVELEIAAAAKQLQPPGEPAEGQPSTISECFDPNFGYISKSAGNYAETDGDLDGRGGVPSGFLDLAWRNFARELPEAVDAVGDLLGRVGRPPGATFERMRRQVQVGATTAEEACGVALSDVLATEADGSSAQLRCVAEATRLRAALRRLRLSNDAIWAREERRPKVEAPWVLLGPYYALCWVLDAFFDGRPIARFWFLETVARMPYFSYISLLHLCVRARARRAGSQPRVGRGLVSDAASCRARPRVGRGLVGVHAHAGARLECLHRMGPLPPPPLGRHADRRSLVLLPCGARSRPQV